MQKKIITTLLVVVMTAGTAAFAIGGRDHHMRDGWVSRQDLLSQLPEEKEMLFHKTMREVRAKNAGVRQEIRQIHKELKDIFVASEFNESLFQKKMERIYSLKEKARKARESAIVTLAKKFTQEERKILVRLIPHKGMHRGHGPGR